ncbi:DUF296 domain-containing protein [Vibrionales bacterium C3R12]|nr:DUF296 domain-containing protein [Vibrionales bacterium C3R12]
MITPIAIRLTQGRDLKQAIAELVLDNKISAGSIASCTGCISQLNIRLANADNTLNVCAPFEIVSLTGTLTPNHQHIHISVADSEGKVWGGHLLEGTIVSHTAELIVHHYPDLMFSREHDASTGYTELLVSSSQ